MTHSIDAILLAAIPGASNPLTALLFEVGAIFLIFWFLVWRPQSQQRKQHERRLMELKRGDEIVTAGGIVGEVVHVRESSKDGAPTQTMEDRVTIKSGEARLIVERGRIARVASRAAEASAAS